MFKKLLIANRGEIACRVIQTAQRLGICTVSVFSEADRDARHVELADEAVCIGPASSKESYLNIERIVAVCKAVSADAVHPGYGFLSENSRFVTALEAAAITFVGPGSHAIEVMGDKIASRKLAALAGLPVVPGYDEPLKDVDDALSRAKEIGYPVMLKASAGGGGKGMRVANDEADCRTGFERARSEARSSFGDDRLLIEKFINEPRHIEIQVLADQHGNAIHLNERECSIQRRHQKVIEEAPSPFLTPAKRAAMGEQALALVRAVDYCSAGTVEFIVDVNGGFYFLEMNTRLQVEHPVTEFITGLDLVEWMLRIAAGESLSLKQSDIAIAGWSMEARVYAEDPMRGFLPSTGRLSRYRLPPLDEQVRVDTGVEEGDEISIHYDPLIAKVVTHGDDRKTAIAHMKMALDQFRIDGVRTNRLALIQLFDHERFAAGDLSTRFIDEWFPDGFGKLTPTGDSRNRLVALSAVLHHRLESGGEVDYPRSAMPVTRVVLIGDMRTEVSMRQDGDDYLVAFDDQVVRVNTTWIASQAIVQFTFNAAPYFAQFERLGIGYRIQHGSFDIDVVVVEAHIAPLFDKMPVKVLSSQANFLLSPMPGLLISVAVSAGDFVSAGDEIAVVEAMKMENSLRADRDAVVVAVHATAGETLEVDQPIIEFEPSAQ